jgi:outer membrane protein, heavy metal efflux system
VTRKGVLPNGRADASVTVRTVRALLMVAVCIAPGTVAGRVIAGEAAGQAAGDAAGAAVGEPAKVPPAPQVTLAEALAAADRMPEMVAARAGERAAAAGVRVAGAWEAPDVSMQTNSITAQESLSLSLPLPLTRGPRLAAARSEVRLASQSRAETLSVARRAVRIAWFGLAAAEERATSAAERAARAERNSAAVEAMFQAGRVARIDRVRAKADLALARAERGSFDEARATAAASLGLLIGLGADGRLTTAGPTRPETEPEITAYLEQARQLAPDVRVQEAQAAAAAARLKLARRGRWPTVALNAGADWSDPTQPGTNKWAGLGVGIPLGAGAAADVAMAESDREAALLERERRTAADAAQTAWRSAHSARLRYEVIDADALPAAREAAELTRIAYQEGRADLFRVLDAERVLADALAARADALQAWGLAFADLRQLGGEETP